MKTRKKVPSFVLVTIALCSSVSTYAIDKAEYVAAVMDLFRMQVNLLEELTESPRFKYSDNLVRNAIAIERTFGLLGPMEWHAVQAASIHSEYQGTSAELDEEMFDDLANASQRSMKTLVRAAHDVMEDEDPATLVAAIDDFQQSCTNCHSLLPRSVAPDLWAPLPRK